MAQSLKNGEYDGVDIMRAWIWLREYAAIAASHPVDEQQEREVAKRLAPFYKQQPAFVAEMCDIALDRRGHLLRYVRDAARSASAAQSAQAQLASFDPLQYESG